MAWATQRYYEIVLENGNPANYSAYELAQSASVHAMHLWTEYEKRAACGQLEVLEEKLQELRDQREKSDRLLNRLQARAGHTLTCDDGTVLRKSIEFKGGCDPDCLRCAVEAYFRDTKGGKDG